MGRGGSSVAGEGLRAKIPDSGWGRFRSLALEEALSADGIFSLSHLLSAGPPAKQRGSPGQIPEVRASSREPRAKER